MSPDTLPNSSPDISPATGVIDHTTLADLRFS
jgi:hypothetical protein